MKLVNALSAEGIKEVADDFAAEIGYRPSCADLFEILTWALRTGDKDKLLAGSLAADRRY